MELGVLCIKCKKEFDVDVAELVDVILDCSKADIVFEGIVCRECSAEHSFEKHDPNKVFVSTCGMCPRIKPKNNNYPRFGP